VRLGLPALGPGRGGQLGGQLVAALEVVALVGLGCLVQDLGDLGLELVVGAVGLLGGTSSVKRRSICREERTPRQ
jgi:hypothetical protein